MIGVILGFVLIFLWPWDEALTERSVLRVLEESEQQGTVKKLAKDVVLYQDGEQVGELKKGTLLLHRHPTGPPLKGGMYPPLTPPRRGIESNNLPYF